MIYDFRLKKIYNLQSEIKLNLQSTINYVV